MNVLICSRYRYHESWPEIKSQLESLGYKCITPLDIDLRLHGKNNEAMTDNEYIESVAEYHHLIKESDILYVLNFDGSFGASMMLEIGYAAALGKEIYCLESFDSEPSLVNFVSKTIRPEEFKPLN